MWKDVVVYEKLDLIGSELDVLGFIEAFWSRFLFVFTQPVKENERMAANTKFTAKEMCVYLR